MDSSTVLVVEHNPGVADVVARLLGSAGYDVISAMSAEQALEAVEESDDIQLLLTDVRLPQMSGPELASALMAAGQAIPVLFMSGYSEETAARHGVLQKSENFIPKPFTSDELLVKVRDVLAQAEKV